MINNRKIKRIARAIMAWGILSLAAAGVVADESPFARPPTAGVSYNYSQWLADASRREALGYAYSGVETFGSFAVTSDESLIGGPWRRVAASVVGHCRYSPRDASICAGGTKWRAI